ncbi:AAA family ATPase [Nonomuraea sp. FMUSA5-5]|uniref:AAA family ATPase n=1 Tax=Nonomuraea composti TaxID=2720023 RepID=A0ABX1BFR6_9ACTN|nr:AAA family ATPase [Nonomuraea sp. FMUSA5-5]
MSAGRDVARTALLLGEAGSGKTALLEAAAEYARQVGTRVLLSRGCEVEAEQSFAGLHQLVRPLLPEAGALPAHQRAAVEAAFGIAAAAEPHDPAPLRIGVLNLLAEAARRRPLLLIVDDVQHFDRDSRDVLGFVTRRLAGEAVTVLIAARGQTPPAGLVPDLPLVPLGPLDPAAAARLLDAQPHPPAGRARIDLLAQAAGNPLAIIELARARRAGEPLPGSPGAGRNLSGEPSGGALPQTLRIQEMFAARLCALPPATRRLVLYAAAASEYESLETIMAAAGATTDPEAAGAVGGLDGWAPAEEAGLVRIAEGRIAFRHPLMRAAAYHAATAHQRQRAHADLAAVLGDDPARRAWHLAAACLGQDESVAAALEDTAELALRRGGFFAAARALERAAECSPEPVDRARRYTKALRAAGDAGDPCWVAELYAKVTALTEDRELLADAAVGAGLSLSLFGRQRQGFAVLTSVLTPRPPESGGTVLALASALQAVAFQSGLPEFRRPIGALLAHVGAGENDPAAVAVRAAALAGAEPARAPELLRSLRRPGVPQAAPGMPEITRLQAIGATAWYADESDVCVEVFRRTYTLLAAYGSMGPAAPSLAAMGAALIDTGRWAEADEHLETVATLAAVHKLRHLEIDAEALRVTLRALRGEPAAMPQDPAWTAVALEENRATHARLLRAAGTAAAAAGDFDAAFRHLRPLFGEDDEPLHYFLAHRAIADLAAAAQRTGRQEEAAAVLRDVREASGPRPTTRMTLLMHHAAALIGDLKDAEHHFRLATVNPAGDQWPLARAQARLHYAQWLRRRRRPLDARPLLATALETFVRLGAAGLAGEARGELRASGAALSPAAADPLSELTAQQRQIVRLAAQGLRNREIAEQLMLSVRTVSSHLYNVYPKLGVSSRHQLRALFDDL